MMRHHRITPEQCRAARALLGWDQVALAEQSGVPKTTVARFETSATKPHPGTMEALISAFSRAGIAFVASEGVSGVLRIDGHRDREARYFEPHACERSTADAA